MNRRFLFLSRFFTGLVLISITTLLYLWQTGYTPYTPKLLHSIILVAIAYCLSAVSINKIQTFPGHQSWIHIPSAVGISFSALFAIFAFLFINLSISFILFSSIICTLFFLIDSQLHHHKKPILAYIALGHCTDISHMAAQADWQRIEHPQSPILPHYQAVIADLGSSELTAEWQKYLATCSLLEIPVYHIRQIEESLTGRSKIRHLYENDLGSLLPSPAYLMGKSLLDSLFVLLIMPVALPIMLLTALAIRIESPGPVLFTQKRVGRGGREFTVYKFRSMRTDSERDGAQFAQTGDNRITRVGHFIRKTRLDELPQFFNILKGEMSLIGPRPEQKAFVDAFEKQIPFYNYRHIVKPGISGWAQVMQGYAADTESTQIKVEYDFYYIKNFSFALDALIFFKTIKTMLTGFGAR